MTIIILYVYSLLSSQIVFLYLKPKKKKRYTKIKLYYCKLKNIVVQSCNYKKSFILVFTSKHKNVNFASINTHLRNRNSKFLYRILLIKF